VLQLRDILFAFHPAKQSFLGINYSLLVARNYIYSGIPISRTSKGNANWFEKSGVGEIEGGIKLCLIDQVLFDLE